MSGDTRLKRTPAGWEDLDDPGSCYPVRRLARAARAARAKLNPKKTRAKSSKVTVNQGNFKVSVSRKQPDGTPKIPVDLQIRLMKRLTEKQGVERSIAQELIADNTYNKVASYGHMRQAGANDPEARIVIGLDSPEISVAYGKARAAGYAHDEALRKAIDCAQKD